MVWLASEVMFFAGLFAAYLLLASEQARWPPEGAELDVAYAAGLTAVLVLSSVTIERAVRAAAGTGQAARWLAVTLILALGFLAGQAVELSRLSFTIASHTYGSAFFTLVGFHGLHVAGGAALMAFALPKIRRGQGHRLLDALSRYWHFVDAVWIGVFVLVYVVQ